MEFYKKGMFDEIVSASGIHSVDTIGDLCGDEFFRNTCAGCSRDSDPFTADFNKHFSIEDTVDAIIVTAFQGNRMRHIRFIPDEPGFAVRVYNFEEIEYIKRLNANRLYELSIDYKHMKEGIDMCNCDGKCKGCTNKTETSFISFDANAAKREMEEMDGAEKRKEMMLGIPDAPGYSITAETFDDILNATEINAGRKYTIKINNPKGVGSEVVK